MSDDVFTEPADSADEWVDVRMTDPEEGEWDIDAVVAEGRVEYVDLRVRPDLLAGFVECLLDDVDADHASTVLSSVAERQDVTVDTDQESDEA